MTVVATSTERVMSGGTWVLLFILFTAIVFFLGYLTRYALERRSRRRSGELVRENARMKNELSDLWSVRALPVRTDTGLKDSVIALPGVKKEGDDLTVIAGISADVATLLKEHGITTLAKLAVADISRLQDLLRPHANMKGVDPITWPYQARLATEGRWKDLAEYQTILHGSAH